MTPEQETEIRERWNLPPWIKWQVTETGGLRTGAINREQAERDTHRIAHSKDDITALLEALDEVRKERDALRAQVKQLRSAVEYGLNEIADVASLSRIAIIYDVKPMRDALEVTQEKALP